MLVNAGSGAIAVTAGGSIKNKARKRADSPIGNAIIGD